MSQEQLTRQPSDVDLEEFRTLVKTLVPTTLQQAEWICDTAEKLLHEHPELRKKLKEWDDSDGEKEEAEKIIAALVAQAISERKQSQGDSDSQKRPRKEHMTRKLPEKQKAIKYLRKGST